MLLVDDTVAAIGSISLSRPSLNVRREVAAVVRDPSNIAMLNRFFEVHGNGSDPFGVSEWSIPDRLVEEDDPMDDLD